MLKIRRPLGRLIFNMGIAIPGKTVFLIETAPWLHVNLRLDFRIALLVYKAWNSQAPAFLQISCSPKIHPGRCARLIITDLLCSLGSLGLDDIIIIIIIVIIIIIIIIIIINIIIIIIIIIIINIITIIIIIKSPQSGVTLYFQFVSATAPASAAAAAAMTFASHVKTISAKP